VISGPYTKGSVGMTKGGFSSRLASDEITTHGYRALPCKVYNYHDSRACGYKRSEILSRLVGMVGNDMVMV
jgi:hypothetical protein